MKQLIGIFILSILLGTTVFAQAELQPVQADSDKPIPVMTLKTTEVDYGIIQQNAEPYREFPFTNTGNGPLIITNAKGSCGCTIPEWPKEPIAPGESGVVKVKYATNRIGKFSKTVTLTTNETTGKHVLRIKGEVLAPKTATNISATPAIEGTNNSKKQ